MARQSPCKFVRAAFRPDSNRESLTIWSPAGRRPAGDQILRLSLLESGRILAHTDFGRQRPRGRPLDQPTRPWLPAHRGHDHQLLMPDQHPSAPNSYARAPSVLRFAAPSVPRGPTTLILRSRPGNRRFGGSKRPSSGQTAFRYPVVALNFDHGDTYPNAIYWPTAVASPGCRLGQTYSRNLSVLHAKPGTPTLCYAIVLPGRKSAVRARFWPDCYRESTDIGPPAGRRPAGGPISVLSR